MSRMSASEARAAADPEPPLDGPIVLAVLAGRPHEERKHQDDAHQGRRAHDDESRGLHTCQMPVLADSTHRRLLRASTELLDADASVFLDDEDAAPLRDRLDDVPREAENRGLVRRAVAGDERATAFGERVKHATERGGGKLRGVGARIVAETFHRAIEGSDVSIVRNPTWRPRLGPDDETFRMVDLLLFAFRGRKALLAPLGD